LSKAKISDKVAGLAAAGIYYYFLRILTLDYINIFAPEIKLTLSSYNEPDTFLYPRCSAGYYDEPKQAGREDGRGERTITCKSESGTEIRTCIRNDLLLEEQLKRFSTHKPGNLLT